MANSRKPEAASLAAAGPARPSPRARLRPLVLALACALLGACAARAPEAPPPTPTAPAGWQAAIGFLDVKGSPEVCTAVLVRPDMIATTSHCLRPKGRFAQPNQLVFTPSAAGPQVRGAALVAEGGSVAPGNIKPDQAQTDWALVRITPPLSGIRPLPLAPLSPAMVRAKDRRRRAVLLRWVWPGRQGRAQDPQRLRPAAARSRRRHRGRAVLRHRLRHPAGRQRRAGHPDRRRAAQADRPHRRLRRPARDRRPDRHRGLGPGVCAVSRRRPRQPAVPGRTAAKISMN